MDTILNDGDTQYAYAVGRIRALEKKLLQPLKIERFIESRDPKEFIGMLRETEYGNLIGDNVGGRFDSGRSHVNQDGLSFSEFDNVLKYERKRVNKIIRNLCEDFNVLELFLSKHDFHNLKTLLFSFMTNSDFNLKNGRDFLSPLSSLGVISDSKMKRIIQEKQEKELPFYLREAFEAGIANSDPQMMILSVDQRMYTFWISRSVELKNEYFIDLIYHMINLENIKAFFRIRWIHQSSPEEILAGLTKLKNAFFRSDTNENTSRLLQWDRFQKAFEGSFDSVYNQFAVTAYEKIVENGRKCLEQEGSFSRLEKLCDDFVTGFLQSTKLMTFGVEPLIAYLHAKENELKILRIIFLGKLFGVKNVNLRSRLPEVF